MTKIFSLALLAGGIALVVGGINANQSVGSDVSRFFTGSPTDKSRWLLIGGIAAVAGGIGGLVRSTRFP